MKRTASVLIGLALIATPAIGQRAVRVKPYVTKSGTFVMPSVRTSPNRTRADNWSSRPNVNPYSGKVGTVDPYSPKPPKRY